MASQLSNILRSTIAPNARESSLAAMPERSSSKSVTSSFSMAPDISRKFMGYLLPHHSPHEQES
jgi:hypothetical protein